MWNYVKFASKHEISKQVMELVRKKKEALCDDVFVIRPALKGTIGHTRMKVQKPTTCNGVESPIK